MEYLDSLIFSGSYVAIFLLMLTNGVTNLPSSQFLYVIAGYFVNTGNLLFVPVILAGAIGNTIGNIITFLLVKKYDRPFAIKLLMMNEETFTKIHSALHETFTNKGMWWIFLGKLTPSIKAFIPVVAGLANTRTKITSFVFLVSSSIWAICITSLGYYFGKYVSLASLSLISLFVGGTILFIVYRTISKKLVK